MAEKNAPPIENEESDSTMTEEEKEKLIAEILEFQNTLHDLSQRVHSVKEENEQLKADNQVEMQVSVCTCYISIIPY